MATRPYFLGKLNRRDRLKGNRHKVANATLAASDPSERWHNPSSHLWHNHLNGEGSCDNLCSGCPFALVQGPEAGMVSATPPTAFILSKPQLKAKPFTFCDEGFLDQHIHAKLSVPGMGWRLRQQALGAAQCSAEQVARKHPFVLCRYTSAWKKQIPGTLQRRGRMRRNRVVLFFFNYCLIYYF